MIQGVLFDMDGVLVDSEEYICRAAVQMFKEKGFKVEPEDFIPFVGAGEDRYIGGVAERYGISLDLEKDKARTYEIYGEMVEGKLGPLPGAVEFIGHVKKKNLKCAVATSADRVKMEINLKAIQIPPEEFDALINGLDVEKKKPDPEIYLRAAAEIGVDPGNCLVVEDAVNGVRAAKAAGARCLALTTSFSEDELSSADWIAEDLSKVPEESLLW